MFGSSRKQTVIIKIKGIPDNYNNLPFGRQLEYRELIANFVKSSKSTWLSQKRKKYTTAINEFKRLYKPTEYYCSFWADTNYRDDSFEIFYKE